MPTAALKACPICGTTGCLTHARTPWQRTHEVPRIRGRKLQRLRMELWAKNNGCCAKCGRVIVLTEMIRDHIVPLEEGGTDTVENTQPLCHPCSDEKTKHESQRGVMRSRFALK